MDEYQDIELELAEMLKFIKESCPNIQIIAVGDMEQKIYDKTTLDVPSFIDDFLGDHIRLEFTTCFRLPSELAEKLGRIWGKTIVGVNESCIVEEMNAAQAADFLATQNPGDILCLGARIGAMADTLNDLESRYPERFNKRTVYASIKDTDAGGATEPKKTSAIFTTYDSSKGLERPVCVIFDYTESYWQDRISKPQQSYQILRNIFCVAASRGKQHIIFVNGGEAMLSEKTIATPVATNIDFKDADISGMFDFKYKEDIEACYDLLEISPVVLSEDTREISIKNTDGLIDLSPCIGIYQEATFFSRYDIDEDIKFSVGIQEKKIDATIWNDSLDKKVLYLTSLETRQNRYRTQVGIPFVSDTERDFLCHRLSSKFSEEEDVQVPCEIQFADNDGENLLFTAKGRADVLKDSIVYELKFVTELTHEHFLQCACYTVAMELEAGILWNTKKNQAYEIRVPNRKAFLDAVAKAVTKGFLTEYKSINRQYADDPVEQERTFAVIDTETNFQDDVMSIGAVIADASTYQIIDSRYYIITPECSVGAMYADALYLVNRTEYKKCDRSAAVADLQAVLDAYGVQSIYAYNASFDRNHLPEFDSFAWYDIMKIAAYKQYNPTIPKYADCFSNGRLKSGYGVEPTLQRLSKKSNYQETHNALYDACDELKIMELLKHPIELYEEIACINKRAASAQVTANRQRVSSPIKADPKKLYFEPTDRSYWVMDELMSRYNVGRHKISDDFFSRGLPYYKEGRSYRFPIDEVKKWEIDTKSIPYGRGKEIIELPAYLEYRKHLTDEWFHAKQNKDTARMKELKATARQHGIVLEKNTIPAWAIFFTLAACALAAYLFFIS